jgi:hypothetical protein
LNIVDDWIRFNAQIYQLFGSVENGQQISPLFLNMYSGKGFKNIAVKTKTNLNFYGLKLKITFLLHSPMIFERDYRV